MKAVIIGATGLVGNALMHTLLKDASCSQVVAITRKDLKLENPKLQQIIINSLDEINMIENQIEGDAFFCCLGTTIKSAGSQENFRKVDQVAVVEFAKIAKNKRANVLVVVTAQGANSQSGIFYNKVKGEVEDSLKKLELNRLVVMRPALLIGDRVENRNLEKLLIEAFQLISPILSEKTSKMIGTDIHTLSQKMISLAKSCQERILIVEPKNI